MRKTDINKRLAYLISDINGVDLDLSYKGKLRPPSSADAEGILMRVSHLMFPDLFPFDIDKSRGQSEVAEELFYLMGGCLREYFTDSQAEQTAWEIMSKIPSVKAGLLCDAIAIYEGDPAARSVEEIILCYPGFIAVMIYRIAHLLYQRNIPYLPRMMTEHAHRMTGIDIHPGARIGDRLCIDHGTGIVIGETAEIGDGVKIYQGVTVGAKSFESDSSGRLIKGGKRHPTIGNNCIIYAGATILGGDTVIGDGCTIGGNVWLTHSVPSGSRVYYNESSTVYYNEK